MAPLPFAIDTSTSSISLTVQNRIVNGSPSSSHEFPFLVRLTEYNSNLTCGGSILSTMLVLTAAHCVVSTTTSTLAVVAGDHDQKRRESSEQVRAVSKIFIHPDYHHQATEHDIALLVLTHPLKFNEFVSSIKIPNPDYALNYTGNATVAGWGRTESDSHSEKVRKAVVPMVPWEVCKNIYKKYLTPKTMLCAGRDGVDSCGGDSGGPLICDLNSYTQHQTRSNSPSFLCGIVSFGEKRCGTLPGVYVAVAEYTSWILKTVGNYEKRGKCSLSELYCPGDSEPSRTCISRSLICNRVPDCPDGEDERHCECLLSNTKYPDPFYCSNGCRIDKVGVCDGTNDCGDNSDEDKCHAPSANDCSPDQFTCHQDNRCIPFGWYCDGIRDCGDGADESDCWGHGGVAVDLEIWLWHSRRRKSPKGSRVCGPGQFLCEKSDACVDPEDVCDGLKDCLYGEDEADCDYYNI